MWNDQGHLTQGYKYRHSRPFFSRMILNNLLISLLNAVNCQYTVNEKSVGVQLFQWPFDDIARECTEFLGPMNYSYVQTSPVQIHVKDAFDGYENPWYIMYQPLGYKI